MTRDRITIEVTDNASTLGRGRIKPRGDIYAFER